MIVYTNSTAYAERVMPQARGGWHEPSSAGDPGIESLRHTLFAEGLQWESTLLVNQCWRYLFIAETAPRSQYDLLVELTRRGERLPNGILCLGGRGDGFHGFKGRPWRAEFGNIHLSVLLVPSARIPHPGTAFTVLGVVSVIDAVDAISNMTGRAGIKWVNDVLVDGAKVGGVLSYTDVQAETVGSAVMGIGLNVETEPSLDRTPFVPQTGCLARFTVPGQPCSLADVWAKLIEALDRNYQLMMVGDYDLLLERYRERSLVVGRNVVVYAEDAELDQPALAEGRVRMLGDDLELFFDHHEHPLSRGRLILVER